MRGGGAGRGRFPYFFFLTLNSSLIIFLYNISKLSPQVDYGEKGK